MSKISYSINWMGVVNLDWYRKNGLTRKVSKVLYEDSTWSSKKKGDVLEYDEIIQEYFCGRIDVRGTADRYGQEIGLDPMMSEDWHRFGEWLSTLRTDDVWSLNELVDMYERTNPKIRWWYDE